MKTAVIIATIVLILASGYIYISSKRSDDIQTSTNDVETVLKVIDQDQVSEEDFGSLDDLDQIESSEKSKLDQEAENNQTEEEIAKVISEIDTDLKSLNSDSDFADFGNLE